MRIEEYLDAVCGQIRWKAARAQVREEIRSHIEQRAEEYAAAGESRELAEAKAVAQMGDAQKTGRELNRLHRPKYDWVLIGSVAALLILGIIQAVTAQNSDGYQYPLGWVGGLVMAIAGCVLFSLINYRNLLAKIRHPAAINLACMAGLALCSILYLFQVHMPLQVSALINDLLFFGMVFSMVSWVSRIQTKREWRWFILTAIVSTLALILRDSYMLEYALCIWAVVCMNRTARRRRSILTAICGAALIVLLWFCVAEYIMVYSSSPLSSVTWAPLFKVQGLKWFGNGIGLSGLEAQANYFSFSNSITDFVWQYGIAAGIALIGICGVAFWRVSKMRRAIRDSAGRMLALCFCTVFFTEAISIILWGIGMIPNQGTYVLPIIALQFPVSLFQGSLIGILISLFRTKDNYAREKASKAIAG